MKGSDTLASFWDNKVDRQFCKEIKEKKNLQPVFFSLVLLLTGHFIDPNFVPTDTAHTC